MPYDATYDKLLIRSRPDYVVKVRPDVLAEEDGPMLRHGCSARTWSSSGRPACSCIGRSGAVDAASTERGSQQRLAALRREEACYLRFASQLARQA